MMYGHTGQQSTYKHKIETNKNKEVISKEELSSWLLLLMCVYVYIFETVYLYIAQANPQVLIISSQSSTAGVTNLAGWGSLLLK